MSFMAKLFAILSLLSLTACVIGTSGVPVISQLEVLTLMTNEKTISDSIISYVSGKDCSTVRKERGKTYCKEDAVPPPNPKRHCYKELSQVTCYKLADPLGRYKKIDSNQHNLSR